MLVCLVRMTKDIHFEVHLYKSRIKQQKMYYSSFLVNMNILNNFPCCSEYLPTQLLASDHSKGLISMLPERFQLCSPQLLFRLPSMVHHLRSFGKGKIVFYQLFGLGAHGLMARALAIHVIGRWPFMSRWFDFTRIENFYFSEP
jgi:hypothetical protein